ncbi:MAG: hypothetical protein ACD_78C00216G0003 [uncultured bacterium (gcode 4)]|uniref:D-alanyl-D-alanine dipeptidase n=1 Tax=uncultured bacterium (gcode 4) TaxID=1234023 RepID=K1YX31_9BACT|nr:MAG: hypothetical protein ACD_78C00216G0003 [uncultured bacterium (gcode 4)]
MKIPESRREIPIQECYEPLQGIPNDGRFILTKPHPYEILNAPYNGVSPFQLREQVLLSLITASELLSKQHPGYKLRIFDAYRPLAVQDFMVHHTAQKFCKRVHRILFEEANQNIRQESLDHALCIFAKPDPSPDTPPPHSTGAAVDLTITNDWGIDILMGAKIDDIENAFPDVFKDSINPEEQVFHKNRVLLREIMEQAGFVQLQSEWWHFSQGDQTAVFIEANRSWVYSLLLARYGRVEI